MEKANKQITQAAAPRIEEAVKSFELRMKSEITRLKHLATINPLISEDEVQGALEKQKKGVAALKATQPRLDSIRLILFQ